ncbi:hypothetical protein NX059_006600 [Plenodomus lindquistii]|nr:hypothetical protein NX059_006600 [Plenodomus lindquistii]
MSPILNIAIILTCVVLIALSAANFYFSADGYKTFVPRFKDVDRVVWFGPAGSNRVDQIQNDADPVWVWLHVDWTTETVIWISGAFSIVAGFLGIGGLILDMRIRLRLHSL